MSTCHLLSWVTLEPESQIIQKAEIKANDFPHFSTFIEHVMMSSLVSRYQFLAFAYMHRLSWKALGDFFREHVRRLEEGKTVYPVFHKTQTTDTPWNVTYLEWGSTDQNSKNSMHLYHCTVPYYVVLPEDVIRPYKIHASWKDLMGRVYHKTKTRFLNHSQKLQERQCLLATE